MEFTDQQVDSLVQDIERQLAALDSPLESFHQGAKGASSDSTDLDRYFEQLQAIEQQTGEEPETFLQRFGREAKHDLCEEGGMLYKQWQKWQDISIKDAVAVFTPILAAIGVTGSVLAAVVVPTTVIVTHLTVRTFCARFSESQSE